MTLKEEALGISKELVLIHSYFHVIGGGFSESPSFFVPTRQNGSKQEGTVQESNIIANNIIINFELPNIFFTFFLVISGNLLYYDYINLTVNSSCPSFQIIFLKDVKKFAYIRFISYLCTMKEKRRLLCVRDCSRQGSRSSSRWNASTYYTARDLVQRLC